MITHLLKKAKKEPVVISNNEKCERDKKISWWLTNF